VIKVQTGASLLVEKRNSKSTTIISVADLEPYSTILMDPDPDYGYETSVGDP
jgi:hypothetical protein